jgi:hypothetical protein
MRILIVILFLFPAWLFSQTISSVNSDGSIIVQMPDGTRYPYVRQKYSPSDTPLWIADYANNSQTSSLETIIIPDSLKFLNNGYIQFNGIGVLKSGDSYNNSSIEMGNLGTLYLCSHNTINGVNYDVTQMVSGENQSFNWNMNDLCRYQMDKSGFHPTEYTSPADQWLGSLAFQWNGLVTKTIYATNLQAGGTKMVTADDAGKFYYQSIPTGGGSPATPLNYINGSVSGRVAWNEEGIIKKEVMVGFENLTTNFLTIIFPIPFTNYIIYGDQNIRSQCSITNGELKVEWTSNLTGLIYIKGY